MRQRLPSLLAAAVLALWPCAAHAAAPWSEPAVVQGSDATYPLLPLVFATGSSPTLVWTPDWGAGCADPCRTNGIFGSTLAGASPGPTRALLPEEWTDAQIAATRSRLIAVQTPAYNTLGTAEVRTGPADGTLGPTQSLGPASTYVATTLATNRESAAVVLRVGGERAKAARVYLAIAPHATVFRKPALVYKDKTNQTIAIAAAMNKRGDVFVAWARGTESDSGPIEGRFRYASGRLGKVRHLGSGSVWFSRLHVALANDRRVIVTWVDQELAADGPGALTRAKLKGASVTSKGTTPNQVLQAFGGTEEPNDISAMFGSDGKGIAAWVGTKTARFARLGRERFGAAADLGPVQSSDDRILGLAAGPAGQSLAAWSSGREVRAANIPSKGPPSGYEAVAAQAGEAAPAFDPVTGSPFIALALRGDDGTSRIAISRREAP